MNTKQKTPNQGIYKNTIPGHGIKSKTIVSHVKSECNSLSGDNGLLKLEKENLILENYNDMLNLLNKLSDADKNKINLSTKKAEVLNAMKDLSETNCIGISYCLNELIKIDDEKKDLLNDKDALKYFSQDEIKQVYDEKIEDYKNIIISLLDNINNYEKEIKKRKPKKKTTKKAKFNQNNSMISSSKLSQEIIKEFVSCNFTNQTVITKKKELNMGTIKFEQKVKETDLSYIGENYKTLRFTREEIQIYLAILNVYMQNIAKKNYGIPFEFSTKDFHNNILGRQGHLQKRDLQKYESIFQSIASKRIIYNPETATISPFTNKEFKNIRINSNLINVDIMSYDNYKDQIIRIVPSALTMLELTTIKQFSNFLPIEIIKLDLDKSDNIIYFALYLTNMHRNNESHIEKEKGKKPKRIYNKAFSKEFFIKTIIKNALPNHKELLEEFETYKTKNSMGKLFFDRNILNPLKETLDIYVSHGYIDKHYKIPTYNKNILDKNIEVIFNYDTAKLIETDKFKKNEKNKI